MRGAAIRRRRRRRVRASGPVQRPRLHQERDRGRRRGRGRPAGLGTRRGDVRRVGRREQVHRCGARPVQGRRVPEHDRRRARRAQEAAFEKYFRAGGGFLGIGSAIRPSRARRSSPASSAPAPWATRRPRSWRRSRSPTAATPRAARPCRSTTSAPTAGTTSPSNVRGVSHVIATVDENTYIGGNTMALDTPRTNDHPIIWCKDYQGGRSFYTALGNTAAASPTPTSASTSAAPSSGRPARPTRSTATAARPCSPIISRRRSRPRRTSTSRSASTSSRTGASCRPPARARCACTTRRRHTPKIIATIPVYTNCEDGLYGPAVDNDFATNKWVYLYYAPPTVRIKKCDGTTVDVTTPTGSAPTTSADPCVWTDTWAGYFQLSRFKFVEGRRDPVARPGDRAEDPPGRQQPRRVLPRRRRHRLRQGQQPVVRHG